ncbi:HD domain-containing protein [Ornithobacterium rhinotracheale]|uniref:HD domain-containing protein n=1 Tax=Ornithobacterium rhinotracheale TaxID=28251 RepID=UPI00129D1CDA|nr:HD domain-containing protein [Ornithobacterium rhinotracheale]MRJ09535.1 HD domain-containing protein [Ornithobacterium rhinotracheale]
MKKSNKLKIFNDPIYGFISIPYEIIFDLIEHKYFQRLRRINQTGLSYFVYPGCNHSRFLHAMGCLQLMQRAIETLRIKNVNISQEEEQAVYIAILLHDVGHGPFSHALESTIVEGVHHEDISLILMQKLNQEFSGELDLAIQIFKKEYSRKFLSQLIASQLDIDRLDYLKRDSFFSGVEEGNINSNRIISMMNVYNDELVIDTKGIYSVEKFLISRMFMYWQVYLHKTSLAAETYLIQALRRAKELTHQGEKLPCSAGVNYFLNRKKSSVFTEEDLAQFTKLDDTDIMASLKLWQQHPDLILKTLSTSIVERRLPKAVIRNEKISEDEIARRREKCNELMGIDCADYFVHATKMKVTPYDAEKHPILLYNKNGSCVDIARSEKQILTKPLYDKTEKYHLCYWNVDKFKKLMR